MAVEYNAKELEQIKLLEKQRDEKNKKIKSIRKKAVERDRKKKAATVAFEKKCAEEFGFAPAEVKQKLESSDTWKNWKKKYEDLQLQVNDFMRIYGKRPEEFGDFIEKCRVDQQRKKDSGVAKPVFYA